MTTQSNNPNVAASGPGAVKGDQETSVPPAANPSTGALFVPSVAALINMLNAQVQNDYAQVQQQYYTLNQTACSTTMNLAADQAAQKVQEGTDAQIIGWTGFGCDVGGAALSVGTGLMGNRAANADEEKATDIENEDPDGDIIENNTQMQKATNLRTRANNTRQNYQNTASAFQGLANAIKGATQGSYQKDQKDCEAKETNDQAATQVNQAYLSLLQAALQAAQAKVNESQQQFAQAAAAGARSG